MRSESRRSGRRIWGESLSGSQRFTYTSRRERNLPTVREEGKPSDLKSKKKKREGTYSENQSFRENKYSPPALVFFDWKGLFSYRGRGRTNVSRRRKAPVFEVSSRCGEKGKRNRRQQRAGRACQEVASSLKKSPRETRPVTEKKKKCVKSHLIALKGEQLLSSKKGGRLLWRVAKSKQPSNREKGLSEEEIVKGFLNRGEKN